MPQPLLRSSFRNIVILLSALTALGVLCGVCIGSEGFESLWPMSQDPVASQIIWEIRVPRTLGAFCVGALLGLSGALAQGLFRNPLADPYLLGSASGATLAVCMAHLIWFAAPISSLFAFKFGLSGAAFLGAMGSVMLTLSLSRGVQHTLRLLLAGVIVGVVLGALSSLLMVLFPQLLQSMQSFMLGSTSFMDWDSVTLMTVVWCFSFFVTFSLARALDVLNLGESTASSMGLQVDRVKFILVSVLALCIGVAVAQAGIIAFVGLVSPHIVRSLIKAAHRELLFLSSWMGAVLLMSADLLARDLIAPNELSLGVITAVLGGGYLLWLMHSQASLVSK
jgi:iron complex transport system permease protein